MPKPFEIEHLCELPTNLAVTEIGVRPCIAFLHDRSSSDDGHSEVEESMIPRLNAKEVAAVFSAPFHRFLEQETGWYEGSWRHWHDTTWRMHNFYVPVPGRNEKSPESETTEKQYRVWGLTARMAIDAARLAFDEIPEFEHNTHIGDEDIMKRLYGMGKLHKARKAGEQLSREELMKASKAAKI